MTDTTPSIQTKTWTPADSAALYRVEDWGRGLFRINEQGNLAVCPAGPGGPEVDLRQLTADLERRDLNTPLLIRFSDILRYRLEAMAGAFATAIDEHDYQGVYQAVYPIKVNQQRHVVEEMLHFGKQHHFGLEAGSKPELLAVMAMVDDPDTPIICNGFKDASFIEAVVLAAKLGKHIIPVIEKFSELQLIIDYAKQHNVRPKIGVRVKLASRGTGRWEHSAGERSKFGLFVSEVLDLVERLRDEDMLDCLTLLHCHVGSQLNDIRKIKPVITELARVYAELHRLGVGLDTVDVGGGLGVDYDGTNTPRDSSMNYTLQEYANDIVFHLNSVCEALEYLNSNPLPATILVTPTQRASQVQAAKELLDKLEKEREVEHGKLDLEWLTRLEAMAQLVEDIIMGIATLLCLSVVLIIGNTIRLAILNQKDAIAVMKLVGATDAFIQRPFLYIGAWYGIFGGVLASLMVALLAQYFSGAITNLTDLYDSKFALNGLTTKEFLSLVLFAIILGLSGSYISVRQHIRAIEPTAD